MLTRLLDEHDVKCEFCNDETAVFRFGQYGKGIGENCIEALQVLALPEGTREVVLALKKKAQEDKYDDPKYDI